MFKFYPDAFNNEIKFGKLQTLTTNLQKKINNNVIQICQAQNW
jgi:hypothetical protein